MRRQAFTMKLKPGMVAEYKKRHDEIWPALARELTAAGSSDYSIYRDEQTLTLIAIRKLGDNNAAADLPNNPVIRKWWKFMSPLMEVNADNSPVEKPLVEIFRL